VDKSAYYERGYYAGLATEPRFREVLALAGRLRGERLLDIGCGDGAFTTLLRDAVGAGEVVGVDIAPAAVTAARQQGVNAICLDIEQNPLPFDAAYFDMVYCGEIIEHLFNPDHLLQEVYRVLKPAGTCILTTPNLASWPSRVSLIAGLPALCDCGQPLP